MFRLNRDDEGAQVLRGIVQQPNAGALAAQARREGCEVRIAELGNHAGIVGAALAAALSEA